MTCPIAQPLVKFYASLLFAVHGLSKAILEQVNFLSLILLLASINVGLPSSIVVYPLNPEGVLLYSLEGCDGVSAYGPGWGTSITTNTTIISLPAGQNTINVSFNGIVLSRDVFLQPSETKPLYFVFPRTELNLRMALEGLTTTLSDSMNLEGNGNSTRKDYIGSTGSFSWDAAAWRTPTSLFTATVSIIIQNDVLAISAEGTRPVMHFPDIGTSWVRVFPGGVWAASFQPINLTSSNVFNRWHYQSLYPRVPPKASVSIDGTNFLDAIQLIPLIFDSNKVETAYRSCIPKGIYTIKAQLNPYYNGDLAGILYDDGYNYAGQSFREELKNTPAIVQMQMGGAVLSSVPYDITGHGWRPPTSITGKVFDGTNGKPLQGSLIQIGSSAAITDTNGVYSVNVPIGEVAVSVSKIGYLSFSDTVTISAVGQTIRNFTLYPEFVISLRRVSPQQANVSIMDSSDSAIELKTDLDSLATSTDLGLGVVADDVTPVLFKLIGAPTNYTMEISHNASSYNGSISDRLFVLQAGTWIPTTSLTASSFNSPATAYAYLSGLTWKDFGGTSANGITMTVNVRHAGSSLVIATTNFLVRPPPIALVHGIADDGNTWSYEFKRTLQDYCPPDFIIPISYGMGSPGSDKGGWPNATGRFDDLVKDVDKKLQDQFETPLRENWAFTRYDVVGHSQGGVLVRMLCQTNSIGSGAFIATPVVAPDNYFRGRFYRVITVGSPHNGTLLARYIWQLWEAQNGSGLDKMKYALLAGLTPLKFDPFGDQIEQINDPAVPVDSRVKFNCIRTTIADGHFPDSSHHPLCYEILNLVDFHQPGITRGSILLPNGSDGVVDFESQGGGLHTPTTTVVTADVPHADIPAFLGLYVPLFGVPPGFSQTTSMVIGDRIKELLNNRFSDFGPFILPTLLTDSLQYDALAPRNIIQKDMIRPLPGLISTSDFLLQVPAELPQDGIARWHAQNFGTNGISMDGVSLQVHTNNSRQVTVSFDDALLGTIVLYATYSTTNGDLVFAVPIVVVSRPPGTTLSGIELSPPVASLSVGDTVSTSIWGKYTNGTRSFLYIPFGQATYSSSNTNTVGVDSNGNIMMKAPGVATITASYNGFTAQSVVSSLAPVIFSQPRSLFVPVGATAFFSASALGGDTLSYQWRFQGTNVPGATSTSLTLTNVQPANIGNYSVAVSNLYGAAVSSNATLNVFRPVVAWGRNSSGQTNVPAGLMNPRAIAAGNAHCVAVNQNGTVTAWGYNNHGQTNVPPNLTNGVAVSSGWWHNLLLKADGTIAGWGHNAYGQSNIPPSLTNVMAISSGNYHNMALKRDGTVVSWGLNNYGQTNVPSGLTNVISIAAGGLHSLALKNDGRVVAWGRNTDGEATVPPGLTNVVSIAGGVFHSLAIKSDGTVVGWGNSTNGQIDVPAGITNAVAIAAGYFHSLAIKSDGNVAAWGAGITNGPYPHYGQSLVPSGLANVVAISAGRGEHSIALLNNGSPTILLRPIDQTVFSGMRVGLSVTAIGVGPLNYQWTFNGTNLVAHTNAALALTNVQTSHAGNYSVIVSNVYGATTSAAPALLTVVPLPSNVISYWPLESLISSNSTPEVYSGNNFGALGGPSIVAGKNGNAFSFNGTNQYLSLEHSTIRSNGLPIYNAGTYTIAMWVKGPPQQAKYVFSEGCTTNTNPVFVLQTGQDSASINKLDVIIRGTAGVADTRVNHRTSRRIVFDNNWHHLAWVDDRGSVKLYIDGTLDPADFSYTYSDGSLVLNTTSAGQLVRAAGPNPNSYFNGQIDEVMIWERVLSQSEIQDVIFLSPVSGPVMTALPESLSVSLGSPASFSVTAQGVPALSYQWQFNSTNLSGQTRSTLSINNAQLANAGNYRVIITNIYSSVISPFASLSVNAPMTNKPGALSLPNGMVNWWPAEGNANDIYGGDNGTAQDGLSYTASPSGLAFRFNGANSYISVGATSAPPPWSASFWVNRQNAPGTSAVLIGDGSNSLKLEQHNGTRRVGITKLGVGDYSFNYIAPTGTWVHLLFVGTSAQTSLYTNGVLHGTLSVSIPLLRSHIGVGYSASSQNFYSLMTGSVDEIMLFNRALTGAEINAIYAAGNGGVCSTPEFFSSATLGNGQVGLSLKGLTGKRFTIYSSTNLIDWAFFNTIPNPNGVTQFTDSITNDSLRFYKASQ